MNDNEIMERAREILDSQIHSEGAEFTSPSETAAYLCHQIGDSPDEQFCVIYLTTPHKFIAFEKLFRGSISSAAVHPRAVVRYALEHNAAAVILAHNHPSGLLEASEADKRITKRLTEALELFDVRVLDHIIVSGSRSYSFAERGLI